MKEFKSLTDFSAFTAMVLPVTLLAEAKRGLRVCAKAIEDTAKSEIGHYQPATGPHPEWPELADSTQEERQRLGYTPNDPLLRSGELRDSIEHEVSTLEAVIGSRSDIAAYQEFGTDRIPARPFMGPAVFRRKDFIVRIIGAYAVSGLCGGERVHPALGYDIER
jgi:HK97 gp10 family phage protein